jgi:hypothetical protein
MPYSSDSATLPRNFRFHYQDGEYPKTPEPSSSNEPLQPPSPPRGPRLKIRRRDAPRISVSTEHFLASLADIPIPTIETSQIAEDEDMIDRANTPLPLTGFLAPQSAEYRNSPPHTPLPQLFINIHELNGQRRYWDKGATTPEERPSSSLSNPSEWSDDSFFSDSRISRRSDDGSCTSPEDEVMDPFMYSKGKNKDSTIMTEHVPLIYPNVLNGQIRSKTRNGAKWSKDMSEHLWQTYQTYLQDPTVTPFRIGASEVPPEGVVHRVAREAKRSWKGPKTSSAGNNKKRRASSLTVDGSSEVADSPMTTKSGSITPTALTAPKIYIQWQHSGAATRNHLRELCRRKDSRSVQRHRHLQSKSPTPFTQPYSFPEVRMRGTTPSSFSTKDIAFTLATSSAESMQPDGPLAKLATSAEPSITSTQNEAGVGERLFDLPTTTRLEDPFRRLGSPFTSKTYGPSSSNSLGALFRATTPLDQTDNAPSVAPQLRSPLHFDQSKSLNGTQKRRAQHALDEEINSHGAFIRPTILDNPFFTGEVEHTHRRVRSRGFSLGDAALSKVIPILSEAQLDGTPDVVITSPDHKAETDVKSTTSLLPSATFPPPRLGSPFTESGASNTFPRRLFGVLDGNTTIKKRGFATVHHTRRSIESFDFGQRPPLESRLLQLDQKLAEIRDRESGPPNGE